MYPRTPRVIKLPKKKSPQFQIAHAPGYEDITFFEETRASDVGETISTLKKSNKTLPSAQEATAFVAAMKHRDSASLDSKIGRPYGKTLTRTGVVYFTDSTNEIFVALDDTPTRTQNLILSGLPTFLRTCEGQRYWTANKSDESVSTHIARAQDANRIIRLADLESSDFPGRVSVHHTGMTEYRLRPQSISSDPFIHKLIGELAEPHAENEFPYHEYSSFASIELVNKEHLDKNVNSDNVLISQVRLAEPWSNARGFDLAVRHDLRDFIQPVRNPKEFEPYRE